MLHKHSHSNLTSNQLQIWTAQALVSELPIYNEAGTLTIWGEIDPHHLQRAFQTLVNSSDALRTVFDEIDGVPMQRVLAYLPAPLEYIDLSMRPDARGAVQSWVSERSRLRLDLRRRLFDSSLLKSAPREFVWYFNVHHLICDGWSFELIHRLVADLYHLSLQSALPDRISLPSFQDYHAFERQYRQSDRYRRAEAYWKKKVDDHNEPLSFYGKVAPKNTTHVRRLVCRGRKIDH